jgi:IS5 family transposase
MKMRLFEAFRLQFEKPDWSLNPEFGLIDSILDLHPDLLKLAEPDILYGTKQSEFGRKDIPSVEQIFRAALYKEMKQLDYRELEYHQSDSRICSQFIKIDNLRPFSFQMYQKYISKIKEETLQRVLVAINKIAIGEGLEDVSRLRNDSTTVETNIHHPTNNSLTWDCIRVSHRLLCDLQEEMRDLSYRDYTKSAKKLYFKINVTKGEDKRTNLFVEQLVTFTKCINQVANVVKKKESCNNAKAIIILLALEKHLDVMRQVYDITYRKEVKKEIVPNEDKLYSIFEKHTDILVKGSREIQFGHKVNLTSGKSNLILSCEILRGNPADSTLYKGTIDNVIAAYSIVPRDMATDGGYASKENAAYAKAKGIVNIVFNKVVGSMKNIVSSLNMETRLKKWRSGIEANISNLKRGFGMDRCNWKGFEHFSSKVLWSVIAYNIRVMTAAVLQLI